MDGQERVTLEKSDCTEDCTISKALEVIGSKWTFLIVRDLLIEGTLRFGELLQSLRGISPKTLSLRLRELEEHGIVTRTVYPEVPPRVEYSLTAKGRQLERVLVELKRFGLVLKSADSRETGG